MQNPNLDGTIAAVATPVGESGIGIVRISGKDALKISDKIFFAKDKKKPSSYKAYTTHYGWIVETQNSNSKLKTKNDIIDEVLLTVMRAPRSYTKEDVVEINCHGGIVALRRVLDLVLRQGARLAEPGEFTKRAFLNGRIDLAQAEAVLDIISSKTDAALKMGQQQLQGALSRQINRIRKSLLDLVTTLEASIDFPEEGIDGPDMYSLKRGLERPFHMLKDILDSAGQGQVLREGLHAVICGRPNVGKSSLLNALLRQERSLVTPIPGTTRDTIEEMIDIKGIPVRVVDTAGILRPRDLVEKKAVERAHKFMDLAQLVILMFDGSKKLERGDYALIRKLEKKTVIAVINKIDLKQKIEKAEVLKRFNRVIDVSARQLKNIGALEDQIVDLVYHGKVRDLESVTVSNLRHIHCLGQAQKLVAQALYSVDNELSLEFVSHDLKEAIAVLDGMLGRSFSEDLLDRIFSQFCVGK